MLDTCQRYTAGDGGRTYLKREGNNHPATSQKRALGESSPGRPLNRVSCKSSDLGTPDHISIKHTRPLQWHSRVLLPLPLHNLEPRLLVEEVVYLDHRLDVLLRGLPALAHERVVELLW